MTVELRLTSSWMAHETQEPWTAFTGQSPEESVGWGWLMAVHSEDRERVVSFGAEARDRGAAHESSYRIRTAAGDFRDVTVRAEPAAAHADGVDRATEGWVLTHQVVEETPPFDLGAGLALDWHVVAEQLEEGVVTADRTGRVTFVNRVARELHGMAETGVRPDEYTEAYNLFTLEGDPYPPSELPLARAVRGDIVRDASWIIRPEEGGERIVRGDAMPIRDRAGRQIGSLLTCRDVSEEESLRSRLDAERQILRRVFEESPGFKAIFRGPEHRFEMVNPAYRALVGDRKLLGRAAREAFPDLADQAAFFELLDRVRSTGETYRAEEERIVLRRDDEKGREERFVDFTYQPLVDERGAVTGVLLSGVDVTGQVERRREEERLRLRLEESTRQLRDRDERFREIADNIDGVFWTSSPDKERVEYLSPAFEKIWGLERARVYEDAQRFRETVHPEDRARMDEAIRTQKEGEAVIEYRIIRPDGDVRWIRTRSSPARDHEGRVHRIVGVSEDITERVQMERRLRRAHKMEALGGMAGRVAHDFNNVLTSVYGFVDLALRAFQDGRDPSEELKEINDSVGRASALSAQLLAFSRDEHAEAMAVDIEERLAEIRRMLEVLVGESIRLEYELDAGDARVRCAPHEIEQIVVNLVANARDAMPEGGALRVACRLVELEGCPPDTEAEELPSGRYVELRVIDTGAGMDPLTLERIFDPFFTTKCSDDGTGLGLSTVFEIVRQRGGCIDVESTVDEGSEFRILLPVEGAGPGLGSGEVVAEGAAPGREAVFGGEGDERGGEGGEEETTVLVVDDDRRILDLVERLLLRQGYRVIPCTSPTEAEQLFHDGKVDVVLTDLGMGGGGAATLVGSITGAARDVPMVFMSGHDRGELERHGISRDALFLEKPFNPSALHDMIERAVGSDEASSMPSPGSAGA